MTHITETSSATVVGDFGATPGLISEQAGERLPDNHAPLLSTEEGVIARSRGTILEAPVESLRMAVRLGENRSAGNWSAVTQRKADSDDILLEYGMRQSRAADDGRTLTEEEVRHYEERAARAKAAFTEAQATMNADSKSLAVARAYYGEAIEYVAGNIDNLKRAARPKLPADLRKAVADGPAIEAGLRDEIAGVKALPEPESDFAAKVRASFDKTFTPGVIGLNADGTIALPLRAVDVSGNVSVKAVPDSLALASRDERFVADAWAEVEAQIVDRYRGVTDTATPGQKARRLADLNARILEGQRLEVAAVNALRAVGDYVPLRAGLDIRAVLGVDGPSPSKRRR